MLENLISGWIGEKAAAVGMWFGLDKRIYRRFHNLIVPSNYGTTQIDHVLVSRYGLFVVETKNMKGWIFGSEEQAKWTQSVFGKKFSFQNPLRQNYRHMRCLSEFLDVPELHIHSVVIFVGDCEIKTPMPPNVLTSGLCRHIRGYHKEVLDEKSVQKLASELTRLKSDRTYTRSTHLASLRHRHTSTTQCPRCGSMLAKRVARKGKNAGQAFLGCSGYPQCKYTRDL